MSDYIKREDAIKAMARGLGIPYTDFIDVAERCMDDIQNADVVEVVRCKDCKWRDTIPRFNVFLSNGCRWHKSESPDDDDYCSYGERSQ